MDQHPPADPHHIIENIHAARVIKKEEGKSKRFKRLWSLAMAQVEFYIMRTGRDGEQDGRRTGDPVVDFVVGPPSPQTLTAEGLRERVESVVAMAMTKVRGVVSCHKETDELVFIFSDGTRIGMTISQTMGDPPARRDEH